MSTEKKIDRRSVEHPYVFDHEIDFGTHESSVTVVYPDGTEHAFDCNRIVQSFAWAAQQLEYDISFDLLVKETKKNIFDGITKAEISDALILAACAFIEKDPAYSKLAARLLIKKLFTEITGQSIARQKDNHLYRQAFKDMVTKGIAHDLLDVRMGDYDLDALAQALVPQRDELFEYMGLKTLYERYFLKLEDSKRLEMPQIFWMRVAMGLAYNEKEKTKRTIEFYNLMSQLDYVPSTPTLLHAGLVRPQLSSCYLTTVEDDLHHIFKCIGDNAQMSKWSGGVANDWTNIRSIGAPIKSIKIESQGLVPFLRIANDVTAAINRSGSRRAATVVYLENWHLEIEDFLELRKNTGDERRRTHDINTACWIPDLFMKRVKEGKEWTLFSPNEVPELHDLYGKAFEEKYVAYEEKAKLGQIRNYRQVEAKKLWRKMLSRLFETGHPWITFKDPSNVRSPQDHVGVVHSSNLCTEIILNTSAEETAVCNLGSINVAHYVENKTLNTDKLAKSVRTAMRMLDNVIDICFYPTKEGETSNMRHRPVGLGQMGFQDALYKMDIAFDEPEALAFADQVMEHISYNAILTSSLLAKEKGAYQSFKGSKWARGIFPQDTIDLLEQERGQAITVGRSGRLDWAPVREHVQEFGMRNSNCMAIAPTATISNIAGCFPCIEPIYKNLYVKSNMSGEFTIVNKHLVHDLKEAGLWSQEMIDQLKYFDGSVQYIDEIPVAIKRKYKEAFEVDPEWLIEITAARGKWIDQSQSHNVFMKGVSGKKLHDIYFKAWECGLKTTYYLRTLGATQIEKSTLDAKKFGFTQNRASSKPQEAASSNQPNGQAENDFIDATKACSISDDPECDVCQ